MAAFLSQSLLRVMVKGVSAAAFIPGFISLGRLRFPVFGLIATAGLVAALFVSERAGERVGISGRKIWDAGVLGVVAAFVASRLLLVVTHFRAFLERPVFVLGYPSLTAVGMVMTAIVVGVFLFLNRIPWRRALDAWAPAACVVAAALALEHFVEGTEAGMPTAMPWGVRTPGDTVLGRVHPVELYVMIVAAWLGGWAWRAFPGARVGWVAAWTMVVGGVGEFVLDMVRQPAATFGDAWLDGVQWGALGVMVVGMGMLEVGTARDKRRAVSGEE